MNDIPKKYSQPRALFALMRASLTATRRNVPSIVFGLIFPFVFIVIFGLLGQGRRKVDIALVQGSDLNNPVFAALAAQPSINIITTYTAADISSKLAKGQIGGSLNIKSAGSPLAPHYDLDLVTSMANPQESQLLKAIVTGFADKANLKATGSEEAVVSVHETDMSGRIYRTIDFILPGMLGFSLLNTGIFATAFAFLNLRQTLVLKRFFTTPISRLSIILGEAISRLLVAIIQSGILIGAGYFMFKYTLVNGWMTLLAMLALAGLGLVVFLGFGLIISSVSRDDRNVAPLAQLVTLPQFLLAGTFFPITQLPGWLQKIANLMPLTFLNDALRKVAFEGSGFAPIAMDVLWLVVWGVAIYGVTVKVFRWEATA